MKKKTYLLGSLGSSRAGKVLRELFPEIVEVPDDRSGMPRRSETEYIVRRLGELEDGDVFLEIWADEEDVLRVASLGKSFGWVVLGEDDDDVRRVLYLRGPGVVERFEHL